MIYTNDFFAAGSTVADADLVQLIDSNTLERVYFKKVTGWTTHFDNQPYQVDDIIYRKRGNFYYINTIVFGSKRVYATTFGVKSSYTIDQRANIQKAIDVCSALGLKLIFPGGNYLVNSFSDRIDDIGHGNILELKSYLDIKFEEYSVITVGDFFDDKGFILFSGFNAKEEHSFTDIYNISLTGKGIIDFSGHVSQMRTGYMRRIGVEGGRCTNLTIDGIYWTNGDLSNCISIGRAVYGGNVRISNCTFENLANSHPELNDDHSTIYGNVNFLSVDNNFFLGNYFLSLIGCACEIHGSNSSFTNNKVYNYTRMNFISSETFEKGNINNILVSDNIAEITNSAIDLWPGINTTISDLSINSNVIKHSHVEITHTPLDSNKGSQWYNSHQCLFRTMYKGGNCERIIAQNNLCHILYNLNGDVRHAAILTTDVEGLKIINNYFVGHEKGVEFYKSDEGGPLCNYSFIKISGNNFTVSKRLISVSALSLKHCIFSNNTTSLETHNLEHLIYISSDLIEATTIRDNVYLGNPPKVEFVPSAIFRDELSNKAKYILSLVSTPVPNIPVNSFGFIFPVLDTTHKRVAAKYELQPTYPFGELFFNTVTLGVGGSSDVRFKVDNVSSSVFPGNGDLQSNIIVDM